MILGSGSPRRLQLLTELGVSFTTVIPEVKENRNPDEAPFEYARRLAKEKARWVANSIKDHAVVISCDTIVVQADGVLEKPDKPERAVEILSQLVGKKHTVCTAMALARSGEVVADDFELTEVYFHNVDADRLRAYVRSGEPMDKAGAYGIQGMGAFLVDRIDGNLDNVIGFPRCLLDKLAARILSDPEWQREISK